MMKLLIVLVLVLSTGAQAQNYLRDDGEFHSVVEGTSSGTLLGNSTNLLSPVAIGPGLILSGGTLSVSAAFPALTAYSLLPIAIAAGAL